MCKIFHTCIIIVRQLHCAILNLSDSILDTCVVGPVSIILNKTGGHGFFVGLMPAIGGMLILQKMTWIKRGLYYHPQHIAGCPQLSR